MFVIFIEYNIYGDVFYLCDDYNNIYYNYILVYFYVCYYFVMIVFFVMK